MRQMQKKVIQLTDVIAFAGRMRRKTYFGE